MICHKMLKTNSINTHDDTVHAPRKSANLSDWANEIHWQIAMMVTKRFE